jgi:outer membrane protein assembly factor BamB
VFDPDYNRPTVAVTTRKAIWSQIDGYQVIGRQEGVKEAVMKLGSFRGDGSTLPTRLRIGNFTDMIRLIAVFNPFVFAASLAVAEAGIIYGEQGPPAIWNQWRGPTRDGRAPGANWPRSLSERNLKLIWRVELDHSYSGPIVSESSVFVTGTADQKDEVVKALDRNSGKELWKVQWPGTITVPFFAWSNGSWIRSTPCFDGESLYVAGMRDVLVAIDAETGKEQWRIDFVKEFGSPLPAFGFVSSPLLDGNWLYVQAGASFVKLDKKTGKVIWRVLKDEGGMMGSAFSSPVKATLAGQAQLVVQTREKLAGVDPQNGEVLWEQKVPNFRGMNILTPVVFENGIFTSAYQNKSWFFHVSKSDGKFQSKEAWSEKAQGYMSTPVVIDGHAYIHLQNQRFACINLTTGERTWTSTPYGKYASLVTQKDLILALDQTGKLLLLKANPKAFELLDERRLSEEETWAHLAVCGEEIFIRELNALSVFRWRDSEAKRDR